MKYLLVAGIPCLVLGPTAGPAQGGQAPISSEIVNQVLQATQPLKFPRGKRLPFYVWSMIDVGTADDAETERILRELDQRGLAALCTWDYRNREKTLAEGLRLAAMQQKLGLEVNVNANPCLHQFFNGDERTAHVTDAGEKFFDFSFAEGVKMGCPFTLDFRIPAIREQVEHFARAYREKGLTVDFVFADWEIDGPIEWNGAWESSRKCQRCRQHVPNLDDFAEFQKALRTIRCQLQREAFADVMKSHFPNVLVGNYGVYPNDGYRYWYDYYEKFVEGAPYKADQRARYRQWFQEFPLTGYTFAMPVVYTWYPTFQWYDFANPDYRWFYNLLLTATNPCRSTPANVPIITFVHWHTTSPPPQPDPEVKQFSAEKYQELLWHLLLRGHDAFFLWCPREETAEEVKLVHEVYAASLEYREFLDQGEPVCFDVPPQPGPVVSGLRLGDRVLVRRTDFDDTQTPVRLKVGEQTIAVPRVEGQCQVLSLGG